MSSDWCLFTEDINDEPYTEITKLLPSSLKEVWADESPFTQPMGPKSPSPQMSIPFPEMGSAPKRTNKPFPFAESAPALSFMEDEEGAKPSLEPEVKKDKAHPTGVIYYMIQFHPNRAELYQWKDNKELKVGDYVVTEADRGFDVGRIIEVVEHPAPKDSKGAKEIVRVASHHEISQLPIKAERERKAKELCQAKVTELGLPMSITGAEFQFDSKKLTFYYTASSYIDFRNLVRILFKTFGMRIWMVWHDGVAPVKDVLQRIN